MGVCVTCQLAVQDKVAVVTSSLSGLVVYLSGAWD